MHILLLLIDKHPETKLTGIKVTLHIINVMYMPLCICSTYLENLVLNTLINNTQSQSLPMLNILDPLPFFPYSNIIRLAPPLYFSFLHFSHASNFLHVTNYANRLRTNTYTAYTHTVKEEHSAHDTNHFQCHSTNPVTYFGGCAIYTFHENWFSLS